MPRRVDQRSDGHRASTAPQGEEFGPAASPQAPVDGSRKAACLPVQVGDPACQRRAGRERREREAWRVRGPERRGTETQGDTADREPGAKEKAERRLICGPDELEDACAAGSSVRADRGEERRADPPSAHRPGDLEVDDLEDVPPDGARGEAERGRVFDAGGEDPFGVGRKGVDEIGNLLWKVGLPCQADETTGVRPVHAPERNTGGEGAPAPVESGSPFPAEKQLMERRSVGRPRDGNPAETRREILRAAEENFAAAGFAGATTRQVAAKAGVNVATLHYHFGNKEGLYRAVLAEAISGRLPAPETAGAPADRLARLVGDIWDFSTARPALARLSLFDRLAGPPSSAGTGTGRAVGDPRVVLLARAITEIRNGGSPAVLSAGAAALFIVTLIDGAHVAAGEVASREDAPEGTAALPREAIVAAALLAVLGRTAGEAPPRR